MRQTIHTIQSKKGGEKIVVLTAYTAPFARIIDPHVDILLVGDSLGMVLYGMDSTLPVHLATMIAHGAAVVRASQQAHVVVDMPFGSYQESKEQAFRNAAKVMKKTGCGSVKCEGGEAMAETIAFLTERAIPVMAHIGLMPQHIHQLGGYKVQGRDDTARKQLMRDAQAVEQAGAYAVVIEATEEEIAAQISETLSIPTIGIGASAACDGQVLVTEDMAGLTGEQFTFLQQFGALGEQLDQAASDYAHAVRNGSFPGKEHVFKRKTES